GSAAAGPVGAEPVLRPRRGRPRQILGERVVRRQPRRRHRDHQPGRRDHHAGHGERLPPRLRQPGRQPLAGQGIPPHRNLTRGSITPYRTSTIRLMTRYTTPTTRPTPITAGRSSVVALL